MRNLPIDIASLCYAIESGGSFNYRFFWGHKSRAVGRPSDECFSQWYTSEFEIDGQRYVNAEQWMMASKARLFRDDGTLGQILATTEPDKIKALGRRVRGFEEDVWEAQRFEIVVAGNVAKFGQDLRLREHILATNDDVLVAASPMDRVWGIGLSAADPRASNPFDWQGLNLLGFALMRARAHLLSTPT